MNALIATLAAIALDAPPENVGETYRCAFWTVAAQSAGQTLEAEYLLTQTRLAAVFGTCEV